MLGISVGGINFCLNALIEKGFVKVANFQKSKNKFGYVYLLTPRGIAEKASLTRRFLQKKMNEYEELRDEIEALKTEVSKISEAKVTDTKLRANITRLPPFSNLLNKYSMLFLKRR